MQDRVIVGPQGQVLSTIGGLANTVRRRIFGEPAPKVPKWKAGRRALRGPRRAVRCNICGYPVGWKGMTPAIKVGEHTDGHTVYVHQGCAQRMETRLQVLDSLEAAG